MKKLWLEKSLRVSVAEDDLLLQNIACFIISKLGSSVKVCVNVKEVLENVWMIRGKMELLMFNLRITSFMDYCVSIHISGFPGNVTHYTSIS